MASTATSKPQLATDPKMIIRRITIAVAIPMPIVRIIIHSNNTKNNNDKLPYGFGDSWAL